MKLGVLLSSLILSILVPLTSCGKMGSADSEGVAPYRLGSLQQDSGLNILENSEKVADQGRDAIGMIPDEIWNGLKTAWCSIDPAKKLAKMDAVYVDLSGAVNYTAVGGGAGSTYALYDNGDGTFSGQTYWHLMGTVGVPKALASGALKVGFIYGCDAKPDNFLGDFLGVNLAGFGIHFGAKDWWMYGIYRDIKEYYDANSDAERPKNFDGFLADYSHAIRDMNHAVNYVKLAWPHEISSSVHNRYPAKVPPLTSADLFDFRSNNLLFLKEHFSKIKLPKNIDGEVNSFSALLDIVLEQELSVQLSADSFVRDLELVNWYAKTGGGSPAVNQDAARRLAMSYKQMEAETTRLARLTHPTLLYSKYHKNGRRIDQIENGFKSFLKKYHGYGSTSKKYRVYQARFRSTVKWARYVLDALDRKRLAIRGLRLLAFEWMTQLARDGVIDASQSIGGIEKQDYLTGCNSFGVTLAATSSGASGLKGSMSKRLSGLGSKGATALKSVINTPLSVLKSLSPVSWIGSGAATAAGALSFADIRDTDVSMSRYYKLPIEHHWTNSTVSDLSDGLRGMFSAFECSLD